VTQVESDTLGDLSSEQGCGAGTRISGAGSGHLYSLAPAAERFGRLKTENHRFVRTTRLPNKLCLLSGNPYFRLRLHHLKIFFVSGHLLGLRIHNPGSEKAVRFFMSCRLRSMQMPDMRSNRLRLRHFELIKNIKMANKPLLA